MEDAEWKWDVNDQSPVFSQSIYNATVAENRDPGEPVIRVSATDKDSEENAVVWYSLLPGPGYELFSINPYTGLITTTSYLDREQQQHFTLRVQARDSSTRPLTGTATVLCSVLDDNDNPPEFMQSSFQVSLPENLPPGVVHTAQASDPDHGENGTIHYSILGEDYRGCFTINSHTGVISTTQVLDREERQNYTLIIQARDYGPTPLNSSTQLQLVLLDQNDNIPSFTRKSYHASISEGLPAGTEVLHVSAFDPDEGSNGDVTYSLTEDSSQGAFSVDSLTGVIRTTRSLDRESRAQYTLRAVATDGCTQGPLSSVASVTIQVEDVNDNVPVCDQNPINAWVSMRTLPNQIITTVTATDGDQDQGRPALTSTCLFFIHLKGEHEGLQFTNKVYNATIKENSRVGTWIAKVEASDQTNSRQRVTYTIFSGNEDHIFSINRHTGEIRLQKDNSLDFEINPQIHLVVLADNGLQTAHCRVSISLLDINDNAPVFEYNNYKTAVWEGQAHNTYIMQVFASDADSGMNGQIEYSILAGNHNEAFILDSVRGILATNALLDREITPSYKLVLQAVDRGNPPLSSITTIRIQVVDVNDNSPAIPPMEPVIYQQGYMVTQVTANDVDLSPTITYSFSDNSSTNSPFAIDRYTGTTGEVKVQVLDVNDNAPVFNKVSYQVELSELVSADTLVLSVSATDRDSGLNGEIKYRLLSSPLQGFYIEPNNEYHAQVSENSHVGTRLVQVTAQDPDLGTNGLLRYDIISGNSKGHLKLNSQSGLLVVNHSLDYEEDSKYTLTIRASDGGESSENRKVAFTVVFISVLDENDNTPYFMFPTVNCSVLENLPVFTHTCSVHAVDNDLGPYGQLTYSILSSCFMDYGSGSPEKKEAFAIDPLTGDIHTRQTFDYERESEYCFVVEARDKGNKAATVRVQVTIKGVDEFSPVFTQKLYHFLLPQNAKPGETVGLCDGDGP
ncbi:Protocadherin-23 Cadherin-27 Cadherin-like protein CDHJ [Larimichthys crocea]|uniref:Protocadherin-23 Cadherin-27 Cadherin-like protein CDHJ n=1 Tax=Larimichthys crocea TaxID=215358 RepID=A0A6G0JA89_LARCR|nr:Protocadherin-23 Cadherin-27 Cadherin-like protein CDHJ [Larimichthys crocea]